MVAEVASALGEFKNEMVFVGGAIVSLYTDDISAEQIRPTQDVDMAIEVMNLSHWETLQNQLAAKGFHPDPYGKTICSYKYNNIPIDIMSNKDGPFGPSNRWYQIGFEDLRKVHAKTEEINILSAPCYLATKFEAFNNRGLDYRTSHDMEDIINILDNRINIVNEIKTTDLRVKEFILDQIKIIIKKDMLSETLLAHIHPLMREGRIPMLEEKINQIIRNK